MVATNTRVSHAETGLVTAEVIGATRISPHVVRLTLGSEALRDWRSLGFDQWFRLALPASEETRFDQLSERFDLRGYLYYLALPKATRPVIRNYTVREHRAATGELDVDVVVHGLDGIAGPWAAGLPLGAPVALIDQGCGYRPVEGSTWEVLVGEESAMPAVLGILRDLPRECRGDAIIEIPDEADRQPVDAPEGMRVQWLVRTAGARPGAAALEALRQLALDGETVSAFVAGEQQLASGGRRHLVQEVGVPKAAIDFTGYWRLR
ncbi:MAG TPA: siderophore-interacting protein [Microbacteriaceae bacterium]|nr:siderophore-interacting protein [Microbacteriaceae bacterium]